MPQYDVLTHVHLAREDKMAAIEFNRAPIADLPRDLDNNRMDERSIEFQLLYFVHFRNFLRGAKILKTGASCDLHAIETYNLNTVSR